jgi:hypothetical protein
MFILSIVILVVGIGQTGESLPPESKNFGINIKIEESGYALPVLVIGAMVLFTSLLGCAVHKSSNNKSCFAVPFGIICFCAGITLFVIGIIALSAGKVMTPEKFKEPICASDKAKSLMENYLNSIDKVMCSDVCPCESGAANTNENLWTGQSAAVLTRFERAPSEDDMSTEQKQAFKKDSIYAPLVPFVWEDPSYSVWSDCYTKVLKDQYKDTKGDEKTPAQKNVDSFFSKGGFNFL